MEASRYGTQARLIMSKNFRGLLSLPSFTQLHIYHTHGRTEGGRGGGAPRVKLNLVIYLYDIYSVLSTLHNLK